VTYDVQLIQSLIEENRRKSSGVYSNIESAKVEQLSDSIEKLENQTKEVKDMTLKINSTIETLM
jgi:hypothetical protein